MTRSVHKRTADSEGFMVDTFCYPHFAYKGARFAATEHVHVFTDLESKLIHALRTLLAAHAKDEPEKFPGHHEAYLQTVALPRARQAMKEVSDMEDGV